MSKDGSPDTSEFDVLANKEYTEEEKHKLGQEQKEFLPQSTTTELQADDGVMVASSTRSMSSISALSGDIFPDSQISDQITKAIRETIIQPQKDNLIEQILKDLAVLADRDLAEQKRKEIEEEKEKDKTLSAFFSNLANREFIGRALENPELKEKLESVEIAGYKDVLSTYSVANRYRGGFEPVQWENRISASDLRATVVKNDAGDELCTLNETMVKTRPFTVVKQDGTQVQISSYREIDFPVKLDKADGSMHLSMVALKADGTKPSKDKAVYFTAHYEEGPNGKPLLKEISSPKPLKFAGDGPDAVAYIEHGGAIYTLAVTRGKYKEMMKEVELNKGQSVDLSQTIAEDLTKVQGRSRATLQPTMTANPGVHSSIEAPTATEITQMPRFQRANPNLLDAVTALSGSMQDLLDYVNAGLAKEADGNKQIDLIKEAATAIFNNEKSDIAEKHANIIALAENTVNNKVLTPDTKVTGIGSISESIKGDNALSDLEKSKMFEATVVIALNSENLDPIHQQQIVEKATELALTFDGELDRWTSFNDLSNAIINSNLPDEQKGSIFLVMGNKVNESKLSAAGKKRLIVDILETGKDAGVLTEERKQLMQQDLDKIMAEQTKKDTIKKVNDILFDPLSNTELKTINIQAMTFNVLDSPAKVDVKGEIIGGITNIVAGSSLDPEDKAEIVKGLGKTVATHSDNSLSLLDKALIIASAEKGIAASKTDLPNRALMTKWLVDGVYESQASPEVSSKLTEAFFSGIDKSTAIPEDKQALKDAANEVALDREIRNLTEGLKGHDIEGPKSCDDIYNKAEDVANALKNVITPVLEAYPEKHEVPEEEVVKKTSSILNDISKIAIEKVNNFRVMLSPDGNIKTLEEKSAEATKKVDELVRDFCTKSSTEEQQSFIKANLIDDKTLSKEVRLQTVDKLLQGQVQKRAGAVENHIVKMKDVRIVLGQPELKPISKYGADIKRSQMLAERDRVNIKDNIEIMGALMNARNSIQSENLNKSTPIKRESPHLQR